MKRVGLLLAGCGVLDGSEIHEATLAIWAIRKHGGIYGGIAPNRDQHNVTDHVVQEVMQGSRNIMTESARLVRGHVKALDSISVDDYDALIVPGGFGAAENLCNYALVGSADYTVHQDVLNFLANWQKAEKPAGFMCISPMIAAACYPRGARITIGSEESVAKVVNEVGAEHVDCGVDDIVVDARYKLVTTPAYMASEDILAVAGGIEKCVRAVMEMA